MTDNSYETRSVVANAVLNAPPAVLGRLAGAVQAVLSSAAPEPDEEVVSNIRQWLKENTTPADWSE